MAESQNTFDSQHKQADIEDEHQAKYSHCSHHLYCVISYIASGKSVQMDYNINSHAGKSIILLPKYKFR